MVSLKPTRVASPAVLIVAMLTAAVTLNYVDRGALGIAVPLIRHEFGLSDQSLGWLL